MGISQLVDCQTGKPGTMLMQVQVPSAARDFSPWVSFQCRRCHGVHTAPPPRVQAHASSSVPTLKIPNTGNYTIGCTEIQHTLIGLGSTALSAPVPYPVKATQISCKRQWSTNKIKNKLIKAKGWGQFMQVVCPTKDEVQVRWMLLSVQTDWS